MMSGVSNDKQTKGRGTYSGREGVCFISLPCQPEGAQPEPISMLLPPPLPSSSPSSYSATASGRVREGEGGGPLIWIPPDFTWNPWTQRSPSRLDPSLTSVSSLCRILLFGCVTYFAFQSQTSNDLLSELTRKRTHDHIYQTVSTLPLFPILAILPIIFIPCISSFQLLQQRQQLPISPMSDEVVAAVRANSVVIVKGNTGCGKTTQVYSIHVIYNLLSYCSTCTGTSVYTG